MSDSFPEQGNLMPPLNEESIVFQIKTMLKDINFTDIPIIFLFVFFVIWAFLLFYFRRNVIVSSVIFSITCLLIGITQILDEFVQKYWTQLYFTSDSLGSSTYLFMITFWAIPLISISTVFLISILVDVVMMNRDSIMKFFSKSTKKND